MLTIEEYLGNLEGIRAQRVGEIVGYIRKAYPLASETMDFAPKTKFPTFKVGNVYVAIASMKSHLSIHFGRYNATQVVTKNNPKIKSGVGCVNIRDSVDFPFDDIKKAIDFCFDDKSS